MDALAIGLGSVLFVLVVCIVLTMMYLYFIILWPLRDHYAWDYVLTCLGLFVVVHILYHYFKAVFSDPGYVTDEMVNVEEESGRKCLPCRRLKPARAHHCSVCKKCVIDMDHVWCFLFLFNHEALSLDSELHWERQLSSLFPIPIFCHHGTPVYDDSII